MDFERRLKGYIAETLVESLLTDAGYKVLRIGLEKRVLDHPSLTVNDDYTIVPKAIRTMPDFMVLGDERPHVVEIKYRGDWRSARGDLAEKIGTQLELYPGMKVVVCCGRGDPDGHARHHLKVLSPVLLNGVVHHRSGKDASPLGETEWAHLTNLTAAFPKLRDTKASGTLVRAARVLADLERTFEADDMRRTEEAAPCSKAKKPRPFKSRRKTEPIHV